MRVMRRSRTYAAGLVVVLGLVLAGQAAGCGTDAIGVDACRRIEDVRCQRAAECGIDVSSVVRSGDPVAGCQRFYRDACNHGLVTTVEPASTSVDACVSALSTDDCRYVLSPADHPNCAWLTPPATPDAATPPADAATD
jgi:hypothetical protein